MCVDFYPSSAVTRDYIHGFVYETNKMILLLCCRNNVYFSNKKNNNQNPILIVECT